MIGSRTFVIWGSSGHAKVLAELIEALGGEVVALFDNDPKAQPAIFGVTLYIGLSGFEEFCDKVSTTDLAGVVAIGGEYGRDRRAIMELFESSGMNLPTLVHSRAFVANTAVVGSGSQVLAQAAVGANSHLGCGCIVNHGAVVDHECFLGNGVHVAPGATLCGCISLGQDVFVGAGAVVLPRLQIGEGSIVGAGAVVTRDVPPGTVVVGNPARPLKRHKKKS